MVSLKKIDNPFSEEMMNCFENFAYEHDFYDCLNRELLFTFDVFYNLRYSFYTYLIVGDFGTWIGYILFYNKDTVDKYRIDPDSLTDDDFKKFNLDIVIRIPDIKCDIEDTYYGFIKETYDRVEELINNDFKDISIIISNKKNSIEIENQKILKMSV